jgi:hypothetical protein
VDDSYDSAPPEVTIEPADNGYVVRHRQRGSKKDEPSRTVRRVAATTDEALDHARTALGGGGKSKSAKKKSNRDGHPGTGMSAAEGESGSASSPAAHTSRRPVRGSSRRRHPRIGGRR